MYRLTFLTLGLSLSTSYFAGDGPPTATIKLCDAPDRDLPAEMGVVKKAVVRIETDAGSGSGFVISPDGFVVTAAHVIQGAETVSVAFPDGSTSKGAVLRVNGPSDLALIQLERGGVACLGLVEDRAVEGSDVFVIGSPLGEALSHSVSKGIVSGYRQTDQAVVMQTDASINPGNSGGVALGAKGQALGVISFKTVGEGLEGLGFAVAAESVLSNLHLQVGDTTDGAIEPWRLTAEPPPRVEPTVEVTFVAGPKKQMKERKACAKLKVEESGFDGAKEIFSPYPGMQLVRHEGAIKWTIPMVLKPKALSDLGLTSLNDDEAARAVSFTVAMKGSTGNTVTITNPEASFQPADGQYYGFPTVMWYLDVDDEILRALAAGPIRYIRYTLGSRHHDAEMAAPIWDFYHAGLNCLAYRSGLFED